MPRWKRERASSERPSDDLNLVTRLKASDSAALEELMGAYWKPLVLYVARLLGDDVDAGRDVAQEAFVRLWDRRTALQPGSMKAFLYRLARNRALDEFRRRDVRRRWQMDAEPQEWRPATPLQLMERDELGDAVAGAINALPPRRREVFTLAYLHQMPYRDIADVMGISPATVKNQLAAALADLRTALRPHGSR